jgi:hypothetical protein
VSPEHDEDAPRVPPGLFERLRSDPLRAPEHIALAAAERHAPSAEAWVAEKQARLGTDARQLALQAKKRHATLARVEGAATGVGGFVTILPDLLVLAWIQSRLVFFVAAAYGYDPRDPMRPAELLVLQQLYDDPVAARETLDGVGARSLTQAWMATREKRDDALASKLTRAVGRRGAKRMAGRLVPIVGAAANAVGNERETRALADRAIRFYGG